MLSLLLAAHMAVAPVTGAPMLRSLVNWRGQWLMVENGRALQGGRGSHPTVYS